MEQGSGQGWLGASKDTASSTVTKGLALAHGDNEDKLLGVQGSSS